MSIPTLRFIPDLCRKDLPVRPRALFLRTRSMPHDGTMKSPAFISAPFHYLRRVNRSSVAISACALRKLTNSAQAGQLYIVSTPIGNTGDITSRAIDILSTVNVIAAEDTRRTRLLLSKINTDRPSDQHIISCHEHNWRERIPQLLDRLNSGNSVAIVSDAGTPCISDPGAQLISAAVQSGVGVVPIPGACAALAALVCCALPVSTFKFVGFLPRSGAARQTAVEEVGNSTDTIVLYEAPHRLLNTLDLLREVEGRGRALCLAREVTKKWEQFLRFDTVAQACEWYAQQSVQPRGEFTIVLGPSPPLQTVKRDLSSYSTADVDFVVLTQSLVKEGVPVSTIARSVAAATGVPRKLIYSTANAIKTNLDSSNE